jgi:glutaminyl-peptide cyclotransferase
MSQLIRRPTYLLIVALALVVALLAALLIWRNSATTPVVSTAAAAATANPKPGLATLAPTGTVTTAATVKLTTTLTSPLPTPAPVVSPIAVTAGATSSLPADAHGSRLAAPKLYTYRVVNTYPHDPNAFTQGLIYTDAVFYEGTGRNGQSTVRRVDPETGKVEQSHPLDTQYFGEGITLFGDKIYQLTWQSGVGFIYDKATLKPVGTFPYSTEGWGITHDGQRLIVSDGTANLQFWDPETLQQTGGVVVTLFGLPVSQLNELEYIDGQVFANIWQTNTILRINPADGQVTGVIDLTGLLDYATPAATPPDVLNGIAYDPATGRLFVTGKLWPAIFEIQLVEVPAS